MQLGVTTFVSFYFVAEYALLCWSILIYFEFNVFEGTHLGRHQTCQRIHKDYLYIYRQVSNISRTLVGNKIVDHSDVVGASPVGAAPTTSSFST